MKTRLTIAAFALFALILAQLSAEARPGRQRGWELLGTRTVTDRVDHDTIPVTKAQGTFRAVRIEVEGRAVEIRDMKIHYSNGDVQDVALRQVIPTNGQSRIIDVQGGDRAIRSIEFWYDAQSLGGKKAKVKVFGRN